MSVEGNKVQFCVDGDEGVCQRLFVVSSRLDVVLEQNWEPLLDVSGDFLSVLAVAVSNSEVVEGRQLSDVRRQNVGVLVHFVRVVRNVADSGCKCEFGHDVRIFFGGFLFVGLGRSLVVGWLVVVEWSFAVFFVTSTAGVSGLGSGGSVRRPSGVGFPGAV